MTSRKIFLHEPPYKFFHVYKYEITLAGLSGSCNFSFLKHSQINSKSNLKLCDLTFTNF